MFTAVYPKLQDKYAPLNQPSLGSGTYGSVYKAKNKETGELVAVKELSFVVEEDKKKDKNYCIGEGVSMVAIREIGILRRLKHKNVVNLLDVYMVPEQFKCILVLELMDMDLDSFRASKQNVLSTGQIREFMYQTLEALAYCHRERVLHRDLKPQNILINVQSNTIKLADFGLAKTFQPALSVIESSEHPNAYSTEVVTLWYRDPDILLGNHDYSTPIDIWSLGCIFIEFATGKKFFKGNDDFDQMMKICNMMGKPNGSEWPGVERLPNWNSWRMHMNIHGRAAMDREINTYKQPLGGDDGVNLLNRMLVYDPAKRITADEALLHPYFATIIARNNNISNNSNPATST